ncbi:MAG: nuclease [Cyanobacteria bacterium SW_9_44_58]|nr:MAG: nuclease [Cyanobacteria bacterium SW_9_44_58]
MLDITKLSRQFPEISQHLQQEASASQQRLDQALTLLRESCRQQPTLENKQQQWRDRAIFNAAVPLEPLDTCKEIPVPPYAHSVFGTDGSQISPSHHEIAYCYLINIGRVMLHYGQSLHPVLDSVPEVFYKREDLYESRKWGIATEEWLGYRRTVSEIQALSDMACRWVNPPGAHTESNLALVDGSLIYWFLENLPTPARDRLLPPIFEAWEKLETAKIPLMSYLSANRHTEAVRFLRYAACPYDVPDCQSYCNNNQTNQLPCQVCDPLRDTTLWQSLLSPGQRSAVWRSAAPILELYLEQCSIHFCYLHVGSEIARVEFPGWLAQDEALLEQALGILLAQVYKGYGYPVALAESHNQAVVTSSDRARFFALLEREMIKAGLPNVGVSYKESHKRGSIA